MDEIRILGISGDTIIGLADWERLVKQKVQVDLKIQIDARKAGISDDVKDTINYKSISKRIVQFIASHEFNLVEHVAEQIAQILLNEFAVDDVEVGVCKVGALRDAREVQVIIKRNRYGERAGQ